MLLTQVKSRLPRCEHKALNSGPIGDSVECWGRVEKGTNEDSRDKDNYFLRSLRLTSKPRRGAARSSRRRLRQWRRRRRRRRRPSRLPPKVNVCSAGVVVWPQLLIFSALISVTSSGWLMLKVKITTPGSRRVVVWGAKLWCGLYYKYSPLLNRLFTW